VARHRVFSTAWLREHHAVAWAYSAMPAVIVRSSTEADCFRTTARERDETVYDLEGSAFGRAEEYASGGVQGGGLLSFQQACERFMRVGS
jgi:hypothetical protein